jgi:radical SAM protein with 4Fe4S-binding SPASM domain
MTGRLERALFPLYRRLERSAQILRYLFIEITQRCNLACLHCGSDCSAQPRAGELDTDAWVRFIDYLGAHLDRSRVVLVITGGEPLCAPGLPRILEALARSRLAFGMVSNGWSLDPEILDRLIAHGLQSLTLSLDGLRDTHDWLRGRDGSFDRVTAAIRSAVQAGLPFFDVVTCANPRNLDQLPAIHDRLDELGVPAWRIFSIFPRGRAVTHRDLRLDQPQLRKLLAWIAEQRRQERHPTVAWSCEGYLPPNLDRQVRDQPYFCRAGINIGGILCDGAITACPNISRELVQGNIRNDDFMEVWETRFAAFRDRSWLATGRCAGCRDWSACQGNSLHLWDDQSRQTVLCHRDVFPNSALRHGIRA